MNYKNILVNKIFIGLVLCLLVIMFFIVFFVQKQNISNTEPEPLTKIRYGSVPAIMEAPAHVAFGKHLFREQGLDVSLTLNPDGKTSFEQLLNGKLDIAAVMVTPVVYKSFERNDFYILGKVDHFQKNDQLVARRDSGIYSVEDLKGKRVAVLLGSSAQFYMDSWLLYNGLNSEDMDIVDMNAPDSLKAIKESSIDAMFSWFPFTAEAELALGENAVTFPANDIVPTSWVIVAGRKYANENREIIEAFLEAIIAAEEFIKKEPEKAIHFHSEINGVNESIIRTIFYNMNFGLTLDQNLLLDMEEQARWVIRNGYVEEAPIPNYLDFIFPDPLRVVDPGAVTIIARVEDDN